MDADTRATGYEDYHDMPGLVGEEELDDGDGEDYDRLSMDGEPLSGGDLDAEKLQVAVTFGSRVDGRYQAALKELPTTLPLVLQR